jgi:hypothetical protein
MPLGQLGNRLKKAGSQSSISREKRRGTLESKIDKVRHTFAYRKYDVD